MIHDYASRLNDFRAILKKQRLDAYIIPNSDAWQSENPEPYDRRLNYICGLDASAGYVVITSNTACVMIDGRYTLSAKTQIDERLFDIVYYTDILPEQWAIDNAKDNAVIGYDPWLFTKAEAKRMQKTCNLHGVTLMAMRDNLTDIIWNDQPSPIAQKAIAHDLKYVGQSIDDKLKSVCEAVTQNEADSVIISADDSIAWLLNLRTIEDTQTPGIKGFAILQCDRKKFTVFTDVDCTNIDTKQTKIFEIDFLSLSELPMAIAHFEREEQIVQISDQSPDWFTEHLNAPASIIIEKTDPCVMLKACKNTIEQDGIRTSHLRDAIAVKNTIKWAKNTKSITEIYVGNKLFEERQKLDLFRGVSFDSIAGFNANGAKIHGNPTNTIIEGNGLLLIDSGGQYDDGTTDITRTIAIGKPNKNMREKYTLVLKAHIALATAIFPEGTTGAQLDAITRAPLWNAGIDFAHGTGHGVGFFLNVHEGPCSISPKSIVALREGMLLSNEPGYYQEGAFGIRLENLMLVQIYKDIDATGNLTGKRLLHFETVTKVPFDEDCIVREILSEKELNWLDSYQKKSQ